MSAGTGGKANAAGGEANAEAGTTSEAGEAGAIVVSGGTTSTLGGAAGTANIGGSATGGTAGASTGGANATGGAAGSVAAAGATTGGVAGTGGTANGGASETGGAGSTSIGGTAGTSGAGTAGADTAGTSGGDAGGAANGGTGGIGGTSGAGGTGIGIGPNTACGDADEHQQLNLVCPGSSIVTEITYASYGTPTGSCGSYTTSDCNSATSAAQVESACLGHNNCTVDASNDVFDDPCVGTVKHLSVQATCSTCGNGVLDPGEVCDDGKTDGVLCSADCSTEPEVAQILVDCGPGTTEINSLRGTGCIVVNPGGASYITFSSPDVEVTLYSNADCTGESKVVSTELNFCDYSFDQGGGDGLNDNVQSVQVGRKPVLPPVLPVDN